MYLDALRQQLTTPHGADQPDAIDLLDDTALQQIRGGDKEFTPMGPEAESLHELWQMPRFLVQL
ncbi:hypothetical protein [Rudanella lutea]|uniref:hypothetical protein n=1 Tax=Rudanella lutea TaxID=451374 RepID=UPI00037658E7|nr:hypothetical protein [Rudanella lutea]